MKTLLDRRIVEFHEIIHGNNLQKEIEDLLNENVINPMKEHRRIDNFRFFPSIDPYVATKTIDYSCLISGQTLEEVIEDLCANHNIHWGIINLDGEFVFSLYYI